MPMIPPIGRVVKPLDGGARLIRPRYNRIRMGVVACTKTATGASSLFVTAVSGCVYTIHPMMAQTMTTAPSKRIRPMLGISGDLNYSTAVGLPALRFGLGSIASNMMIGK
jgi:hypothetical protein